MRKQILIFFLSLCLNPVFSQIGIGQWRDHLPYKSGISVVEASTRIYCATPYSLFFYEKADNSIAKLSKVNGLSDVGISKIKFDESSETLIIAYKNSNLDLSVYLNSQYNSQRHLCSKFFQLSDSKSLLKLKLQLQKIVFS